MGLSASERRLVQYPPTQKTWACGRKSKTTKIIDGLPVEVEFTCPGINPGTPACTTCCRKKPAKPKLLWPLYLAACKKAGIEPKGGSLT